VEEEEAEWHGSPCGLCRCAEALVTAAFVFLVAIYSERWLRPIASTVNHVVDRGLNPQPSG